MKEFFIGKIVVKIFKFNFTKFYILGLVRKYFHYVFYKNFLNTSICQKVKFVWLASSSRNSDKIVQKTVTSLKWNVINRKWQALVKL